jgi:hypothetical protein
MPPAAEAPPESGMPPAAEAPPESGMPPAAEAPPVPGAPPVSAAPPVLIAPPLPGPPPVLIAPPLPGPPPVLIAPPLPGPPPDPTPPTPPVPPVGTLTIDVPSPDEPHAAVRHSPAVRPSHHQDRVSRVVIASPNGLLRGREGAEFSTTSRAARPTTGSTMSAALEVGVDTSRCDRSHALSITDPASGGLDRSIPAVDAAMVRRTGTGHDIYQNRPCAVAAARPRRSRATGSRATTLEDGSGRRHRMSGSGHPGDLQRGSVGLLLRGRRGDAHGIRDRLQRGVLGGREQGDPQPQRQDQDRADRERRSNR